MRQLLGVGLLVFLPTTLFAQSQIDPVDKERIGVTDEFQTLYKQAHNDGLMIPYKEIVEEREYTFWSVLGATTVAEARKQLFADGFVPASIDDLIFCANTPSCRMTLKNMAEKNDLEAYVILAAGPGTLCEDPPACTCENVPRLLWHKETKLFLLSEHPCSVGYSSNVTTFLVYTLY